ncbi:MAG: HAMP domain-containing sensor histidine kinase [Bdellovibrionota bacterium]
MKVQHDQYRLNVKHKIRTTLFFYYFFPILVVFSVLGFSFYWLGQQTIERELGDRLTLATKYIVNNVKPFQLSALEIHDRGSQTYQRLYERTFFLLENQEIKRVYVLSSSFDVLFDSDTQSPLGQVFAKTILHKNELQQALKGKSSSSVLFKKNNNEFYKSAFSPIFQDDKVVGIVGIDGSARFFQNLDGFLQNAILITLFCLGLITLLSFFLSKRILTPVAHLVRGAQDIGEGEFEKSLTINDGSELGFLAFVLDEMRKKILERDQNMKLMLRGIAHEIRNPLGGIELFAGILAEHVQHEKELNAVKKIQNEIQNLKKTVDDFTNFAKDPILEFKEVVLSDFFDEIRDLFSKELCTQAIKFRLEIEDIERALFDPIQMQRVFLNLVTNSIQAMPKGGKISIHVKKMEQDLVMVVEDNGQGIEPDHMKELFQPFHTTKADGNGLGLALVKKIILSHGGQIEISSSPGEGTQITITLPWR